MTCDICSSEMDFIRKDYYTIGESLYFCVVCEEEFILMDPVCEDCGDPQEYCICQ